MWVCTYGEAPPLSARETPAAAGSLVSAVLGVSTVPSEEEQQEQQRLMQGAPSLVCCDCLPAHCLRLCLSCGPLSGGAHLPAQVLTGCRGCEAAGRW